MNQKNINTNTKNCYFKTLELVFYSLALASVLPILRQKNRKFSWTRESKWWKEEEIKQARFFFLERIPIKVMWKYLIE